MATDASNLLLNLPWQLQVAIASGYAAYLLAYRGIRSAHNAIDTTFITLVFGLVATSVIALLRYQSAVLVIATAFATTCFVAILWRRFFSRWLNDLMHHFDISWSNDDPSALASLSNNSRYRLSQVAVELDDGTWLSCVDTAKFADAPFGPIVLGPNGDIAIYLTHEQPPGGEPKELTTVRDEYYGDRVTYIPSDRIKRITFRHKRKSSRP